ncbi:penicillin-binding protein 1A [Coralliovum pocilloporae]|uniref:penicillin-binding protein 1A n=1 Tax=Coralliovum pocilloporae TaxID=3066369 RepID=UPI003306AF3A
MGVLRLLGFFFTLGTVLAIVGAGAVGIFLYQYTKDLPDYEVLRNYEPPVTTRVHADDGQLIAEYAHERRLYLPAQAIPERVKQAFLSAEDKNFYEHPGIDVFGIMRAVVTNFQNLGTGRRLVGASTITQQVAKNFLLTNERSYERKIKEAILSMRIEQAFNKEQILELYLNEIFLGAGSYGVAGAALNYFDKSVHELTVAEAAYLGALPKAPSNYHPFRQTERAIERRNWVIDRMLENGHISVEEADAAKATQLGVTLRARGARLFASEYFAEEVRRTLIDMYSEDRLYKGGLSVRTTLDPNLQVMARRALIDGLIAFDRRRGWRGPVKTVAVETDWAQALKDIKRHSDVPEWKTAIVLKVDDAQATVGIRPETLASGELSDQRPLGVIGLADLKWAKWATGDRKGRAIRRPGDVLSVGDIIYVSVKGGEAGASAFELQQIPKISGALVAMDPYTGRVKAMVGGFSFDQSQFNRATQAYRQPGSSFKPFVYAAALDNGYSPSSVVMDAPIEIEQGGRNDVWRPQNYGGKFYGPSTLRLGIERSRNVMTVRLAKDMGMPLVAEYARRFGIYDNMQPVLSMSLGAGETTVLRMTTAYSILANGGRKVKATLIDRIQDRYGRTIYRHDERTCDACSTEGWADQAEPEIVDEREQILDPMTAYQITSMMEGVVLRGTAPVVKEVGKPIAGKTGTTNDEKDAWFVGFSPDMAVGVFIGYDQPRAMGRGSTGGQLAAPIFTKFMQDALKEQPAVPFAVPEGLSLIPINRRTGLKASPGEGGVIMEAFKPGTTPPDSYSVIGFTDEMGRPLVVDPESDRALGSGTGGLY